ncbi:MAG: DUF1778 domain-containing protein [Blastocatellia bacterium]
MSRAKPIIASPQKLARLNLRVTSHQKEVIAKAAELKQTTMSDFIMEKAYQAASEILAEQTHFELPTDKWEEFCAALDAPPREIPALRKLLTQPSVLDE